MTKVGLWLTDLHLHLNNVPQFESAISQAIGYCKENGIKYIFNGGDTFTSRKGQPQEVLKVLWDSLEKLRKAKIVMYVIVGNHDKTNYSSRDSFLIPFQDHPAMTLVESYDDLDIVEGLRIHMVSFFEDEMFLEQLSLAKTDVLEGVTNICLTHIGISGAKMNSGISLKCGVTAADFKEFDVTYVGHYHNQQQLNESIFYTGSTYPHNFGEDNQKCMYVLLADGSMSPIETHFPKYLTKEVGEVSDDLIGEILADDPIGANHHRVKCTKILPMQRSRLEAAGVKVMVEKTDLLISTKKAVVERFDNEGIVTNYSEWAKKRSLKKDEVEHGMKLLNNVL